MTEARPRDPRTLITPDAFEVSEDLIGMPLASPGRRAAALLIDGLVIGVITAVTQSFALILGVLAAVFFVRAGFSRTKVRNGVFGRAMRASVGCLGLGIAVTTAVLWIALRPAAGPGDPELPRETVSRTMESAGMVFSGLQAAQLAASLGEATSMEEAESLARELVGLARSQGWDEGPVRAALLALPREDGDWRPRWESWVDQMLAEGVVGDTMVADLDPAAVARDRVAGLTDPEALTALAGLLDGDGVDREFRGALQRRLSPVVAVDTLNVLQMRSDQLARRLEETEEALVSAREDLEEVSGGGVLGWLRRWLDDLGFGFGWAALYTTVTLSRWNGQTVGKRVLGIRVVRLDGEAITWWTAFERAGGYAAGLATGLLGFAQVWWDANRQAIHDRIVGTAVIREGAARITDWESVL